MSRFITAFFALAFALGLAGCNTIEGAGKDVSKAGEKIEDAAKKNK
jgi:predicted small secreted protein